jgi:hypothetical protein
MKRRDTRKVPVKEKVKTPVDRARDYLGGSSVDGRGLSDALRVLLDDDPGNLNARFMLDLYLRHPHLATVLRLFTSPQIIRPIARALKSGGRGGILLDESMKRELDEEKKKKEEELASEREKKKKTRRQVFVGSD